MSDCFNEKDGVRAMLQIFLKKGSTFTQRNFPTPNVLGNNGSASTATVLNLS